ncbi:MAG: hypothetical protein AAF724_03645 [Pseudomonadota bacterium]
MSTPERQRTTEGMVDYGKHSLMQQQLVLHHDPLIRALVGRLAPAGEDLRLVDYGCGPGDSALQAVMPAIETWRARFADAPVSVCHADQPGNDWNGLFARVTGPDGYAAPGMRTSASIGSFYERMVDDGAADFATCFMASHWLRHSVSVEAPGTVWFADMQGEARMQMAARALEDWARFLDCRARELRSGGVLLVSCLGTVPDESEINGHAASGRAVYRAIQKIAQDMADAGWIDPAVLDRFVFGLWFLTADEARQPLEADAALAEAFAIEQISVVPAPQNPKDVYAHLLGDVDAYARAYVGYIRGFAHSTLATQLFGPGAAGGRSGEAVAQEFYRRLDALYRDHPGEYAGENFYLTVVLSRR